MGHRQWMIYGAYGYTGQLIAAEAHRRGLRPVLAGRDRDRLKQVARQYGFEQRAFEIDHARGIKEHLDGIGLVLLCAGPFSATSGHVIKACLARGAHYLDITGEISVFEEAHEHHRLARQAGIVICPGVGFDVVPTDCLALALKQALPDADCLALGFDSRSPVTAGTAKTAVEGLAYGGCIRREGQLRNVPLAHHSREIDFGAGRRHAVTIPWGDVATAYYSTGIPNIEVYVPMARRHAWRLKILSRIRPVFGLQPLQRSVKRMVERRVQGPDPEQLRHTPSYVWGEARSPTGQTRTARVRTANLYEVTAHSAVGVVQRLLATPAEPGFSTPAQLMGADFVTTLPGSGPLEVS